MQNTPRHMKLLVTVPLRLALLVFMIWIAITMSRGVCCMTFTLSDKGFADFGAVLMPAFTQCVMGQGEPALFIWA